jgi:carbamoyltransferase
MLFTALVADKYRIQRSVQDFNTSDEDIDLIKIVNKARSKIPAVTHIDNSARLQTIASDNPVHGVLSRYFRLSHVPVLVNTSFNVRNEPIVESPSEAIRCFMTTDIDILVMENFMAMKKNQTIESLNVWKSKHYIGDLD